MTIGKQLRLFLITVFDYGMDFIIFFSIKYSTSKFELSLSKVPILQAILLFRMKLWQLITFFHSLLGWFFLLKREEDILACSLFEKKHPPKSE